MQTARDDLVFTMMAKHVRASNSNYRPPLHPGAVAKCQRGDGVADALDAAIASALALSTDMSEGAPD